MRSVISIFVLFACLVLAAVVEKREVSAGQQGSSTSAVRDGLRVLTIDAPEARVTVKLPDDVRTGDRISGTVVTEPKGNTPQEQATSRAALRARIVRMILSRTTGSDALRDVTIPLSGESTSAVKTSQKDGNSMRIEFTASPGPDLPFARSGITELGRATIPIDVIPPASPVRTPSPSPTPGRSGPNAGEVEYGLAPAAPFSVPSLGQQGLPIQITGPFDGSADTTVTSLGVTGQETDTPLVVLAESPRKAIIANPADLVGQGRIDLNESGVLTSAPYRNVAVRLSAPKTSLIKGETTEMRAEVLGLSGITEPVPVTLTASGVITMAGGPYQSFLIDRTMLTASGSYITTRKITGLAAGAWGATLTVVTRNFDVCLQDDATGTILRWSSLTGEYWLSTGLLTLAGRGKVARKDCTMSLEDSDRKRKVKASSDVCGRTGSAETKSSEPIFDRRIIDSDLNNSFCVL